jgi:hypothetical protein
MPTIEIGVDFSEMKDLDKFAIVPAGTYEFTVRDIKSKNSKAGRPMLTWSIQVTDPVSNSPTSVLYNTVLPWMKDGQWDVSGCGMLVQVCKALGLPWTGRSLDTEAYVGRNGNVDIIQKPRQVLNPDTGKYENDPSGDVVNDVKGFVY